MKPEDTTSRFAADLKGLQDLRLTAKQNPREALKAAAQQFEALFMQMMLKSMRDATPQDGLFDSDQTRFYTSMFDQQLAQGLSGKNAVGLAALLEQQLGRGLAPEAATDPATWQLRPPQAAPAARPAAPMSRTDAAAARPAVPAATAISAAAAPAEAETAGPREFVERIWPHALTASAETGIPPAFLVAHAALESGWGRSEIRRADGSPSFNVFGVKAGRRWSGEAVEAATTEYVDGVATSSRERFRAYGSYLEAFRDYAALLRNSPRFAPVLGAGDGTEFARQLQQAGYATDPMYADKLSRILSGQTLRRALSG